MAHHDMRSWFSGRKPAVIPHKELMHCLLLALLLAVSCNRGVALQPNLAEPLAARQVCGSIRHDGVCAAPLEAASDGAGTLASRPGEIAFLVGMSAPVIDGAGSHSWEFTLLVSSGKTVRGVADESGATPDYVHHDYFPRWVGYEVIRFALGPDAGALSKGTMKLKCRTLARRDPILLSFPVAD
jgi:hypothetical protein